MRQAEMAISMNLIESKMRERKMFMMAMHGMQQLTAEQEEERLLQQAIEESKQMARQNQDEEDSFS